MCQREKLDGQECNQDSDLLYCYNAEGEYLLCAKCAFDLDYCQECGLQNIGGLLWDGRCNECAYPYVDLSESD